MASCHKSSNTNFACDPTFQSNHEFGVALILAAVVLIILTTVKPLGSIPVVGSVAFTIAAVVQLYFPVWRCDRLKLDLKCVGLHLCTWEKDLSLVLLLCAIFFVPYALLHHMYMVHAHDWLMAAGLESVAHYVPNRMLQPHLPTSFVELAHSSWWFLGVVLTHTIGVALPEETFYRGYLQPQLQAKFGRGVLIFGVPLGFGAVVAACLFALGHFLGEWNPLRLGPFFPALVFAWLRNATGSVVGAIGFHAACNVFGEVLFSMYS